MNHDDSTKRPDSGKTRRLKVLFGFRERRAVRDHIERERASRKKNGVRAALILGALAAVKKWGEGVFDWLAKWLD